jgi:hypothetical protein
MSQLPSSLQSVTTVDTTIGRSELNPTLDLSLASNRFRAARRDIDRSPCINPLGTIVWTTAEAAWRDHRRWRDMGNGVFYLVGE